MGATVQSEMPPMTEKTESAGSSPITRIEVFDQRHLIFKRLLSDVKLSFEDDGKTLKIFSTVEYGTPKNAYKYGMTPVLDKAAP
jgi:hypothetical protein